MAHTKSKSNKLSQARPVAPLVASLERNLAAYAGAAVAAGVSLAVLTPATEAEIVYTPTNTVIKGELTLDLNNDGIADFVIANGRSFSAHAAVLRIYCAPTQAFSCNYPSNQIWGRGLTSGRFASALPAGFPVGPNKSYFQAAAGAMMAERKGGSSGSSTSWGQWNESSSPYTRYLGLQFVISGEVHYGWARIEIGTGLQFLIAATLTGYAYETIPNKPIVTGKTKGPDVITLEPATLGHLAQGASQIQSWRPRD
jgi:hypothetical protein